MKRFAKILCAILVVALLASVLVMVVAADANENVLAQKKILGVVTNDSKNTKVTRDMASNSNEGLTYVYVEDNTPSRDAANVYMQMYTGDAWNDAFPEGAGFYVLDFDFCTGNNFYNGMTIWTKMDGLQGETVKGFIELDASYDKIKDNKIVSNYNGEEVQYELNTDPFVWQHITVLYDLTNNIKVVYVDGEPVAKHAWHEEGIVPSALYDTRLNLPGNLTNIDGLASMGLANPVATIYAVNEDVTAMIEGDEYLEDIEDECAMGFVWNYDYELPASEYFYTVGETGSRSFAEALLAANSVAINVVKSVETVVTVDKECVVNTNGNTFNYVCPGFSAETTKDANDNDVISFSSDATKYTAEFYVKGEVVKTESLKVGSELTPPVVESYTADGKFYCFGGWATTEGGEAVSVAPISADVKYYALFSEVAFQLISSENVVKKDYPAGTQLSEVVNAATDGDTVKFYTDALSYVATLSKSFTFDLNGYTFTTSGRFTPSGTSVVTVKNGKIVVNSMELFYCAENNPDVTIVFENVEVSKKSGSGDKMFFELRAGSAILDNVTVKADTFKDGGQAFISLGHRVSGDAPGKVNLTVKNCNVNVAGKDFASLNQNEDHSQGFDLNVVIENSNIIAATALYANSKNATGAIKSTVELTVDSKTTITVSSAVLNIAKNLKAEGCVYNFAEGAKFSKLPAPSIGTLNYAEGCVPAFDGTNYVVTDTYYVINFVDGENTYTYNYTPDAAVTAPVVGTVQIAGVGSVKIEGGVSYLLAGWATTEGGEVAPLAPATANATYYSVWTAKPDKYVVNFCKGTEILGTAEYTYGQTPVAPTAPATYEKDGKTYAFAGWATTEGGAAVAIAPVSDNANYYAVYVEAAYLVTTKDGKTTYYPSSSVFVDLVSAMPADSTLTLYVDVTITKSYEIKKTITIDANGHTISTNGTQIRFNMYSVGNLTVKNAKFVIAAGSEFVHMQGDGAVLTIINSELLSSGRHFVELRTGKLTLDGFTIKQNAPVARLISSVYRTSSKTVELVIKNSELNLGGVALIDGGLAASGDGSTNGFNAKVVIENSVIKTTSSGSLISFNGNAATKDKCTIEVSIDGFSSIICTTLATKGANVATATATIADGAKFNKAPVFADFTAVNYPEGAKALASGDATYPVIVTSKFVTLNFVGVGAVDYLLDANVTAPELGPTKVEGDKTYKFLGWATTEGATAPEELGKATVNATYYPVWEDVSAVKFTVVFMDGETVLSTNEYGAGETIVIPEYARIKQDGDKYYYFVWSNTVDGNEVEISTASENVTFYAAWKELYFTVTAGANVSYYGLATDLHVALRSGSTIVPANATVTLYADFDFGEKYANSGITPVAGLVLDLNGFTMTMGSGGSGRFGNGQYTFKNGKICVRSNIFYSDKSTTSVTFDNVEIFNYEGKGSDPVDIRGGTVTFNNCNVHDFPRYLVHMAYRMGGLNKVVINNSTIVGNKNYQLFQASPASGEKNAVQIEVEINNSVVINPASDILFNFSIGDATLAAASSVNIKIDGSSKVSAKSASLVSIGGALTKDQVTVTIAEGARFGNGFTYDAAKVTANIAGGTGVIALVDRSAYAFSAVKSASSITWDADVDKYDVTELWATGVVPVVPQDGEAYKFITDAEIVAVAGDATYVGTYEMAEIKVMQNLTLYTDISFNIYLSKSAAKRVFSITFDGMPGRYAEAKVWGDYYVFTVPAINPIEAGRDIVLRLSSRGPAGAEEIIYTLSVTDYAKALLESDCSDESKALVADLVNYIDAAYVAYNKTADATYAKVSALAALVDEYETKNVVVPETDASMAAVNAALESAQLYLDNSAKLRFNIKAGYNGTVTFTYLGNSYEFVVVDGKVGENAFIEVDLRAYQLTTTIEVKTAEGEGAYNLAAYAKAVEGTNFEALVEALYAYVSSAAAYNAFING